MSVNNNPQELVKVVDGLMDELDQLAASPLTKSSELFGRALDTLALVIQPQASAVFLLGPDRLPINATSSESIESYFSSWPTAAAELADGQPGWCQQVSQQSASLGFALKSAGTTQGVMVAKVAPNQRTKSTLSLMQAIADLSSRHIELQLTQATLDKVDFLSQVNEFSLGCLSSVDEREIGKVIVNDVRNLMACERVQYFRAAGNRLDLAAVSSVAVFEKRTEVLRCSTQLAKLTHRRNSPLLSSQPPDDRNIQAAVATYRELSGLPFFALFPLQARFRHRKPTRSGGVLLVEYAEPPNYFEFVRAAKIVVPQSSLAIFNAKKVSSIPFHRLLMFLGDRLNLGSLTKLLLGVGIPLALLLMTMLIRTDFKIRMNGVLRPVTEQLVFSPHDAFVDEVLIEHGEAVDAGELLLKLRSPALNLELEETIGEIKKLTEFKAAKNMALNQAPTRNADDSALPAKLASEIADLEFQISSLVDKQSYVQRRIDELSIYAPIAGKVVTWNVKKLLQEKPVRWGDPLLKIADEASDWELRFKASEKKIGYVLQANSNQNKTASPADPSALTPMKVIYFFQSNPEQKFSTVIRSAASSTELDTEVGPSVAVYCDVDDEQQLKRHGAKVVGDVVCGKRSIAYVWTYELMDAIRRQFVW
jgi:hypothetical protein